MRALGGAQVDPPPHAPASVPAPARGGREASAEAPAPSGGLPGASASRVHLPLGRPQHRGRVALGPLKLPKGPAGWAFFLPGSVQGETRWVLGWLGPPEAGAVPGPPRTHSLISRPCRWPPLLMWHCGQCRPAEWSRVPPTQLLQGPEWPASASAAEGRGTPPEGAYRAAAQTRRAEPVRTAPQLSCSEAVRSASCARDPAAPWAGLARVGRPGLRLSPCSLRPAAMNSQPRGAQGPEWASPTQPAWRFARPRWWLSGAGRGALFERALGPGCSSGPRSKEAPRPLPRHSGEGRSSRLPGHLGQAFELRHLGALPMLSELPPLSCRAHALILPSKACWEADRWPVKGWRTGGTRPVGRLLLLSAFQSLFFVNT